MVQKSDGAICSAQRDTLFASKGLGASELSLESFESEMAEPDPACGTSQ